MADAHQERAENEQDAAQGPSPRDEEPKPRFRSAPIA